MAFDWQLSEEYICLLVNDMYMAASNLTDFHDEMRQILDEDVIC